MANQEFDHVVHHRDLKTGKVNRVNAYSMECHKDLKFYRRGGKCFDAAGVEIADPKLQPVQGTNFTRSKTAQETLAQAKGAATVTEAPPQSAVAPVGASTVPQAQNPIPGTPSAQPSVSAAQKAS